MLCVSQSTTTTSYIGKSLYGYSLQLTAFTRSVDLVTAQVVDIVTLQPVLPASGLSACPGQDVTLLLEQITLWTHH